MKRIVSLLLGNQFDIRSIGLVPYCQPGPGYHLFRFYCKNPSVDSVLFLLFQYENIDQNITSLICGEILKRQNIFRYLSGKQVFIKTPDKYKPRSIGPAFLIRFIYTGFEKQKITGELVLDEVCLSSIFQLFDLNTDKERLMNDIDILCRKIYERLSIPPEGFGENLTKLQDRPLQLLLNRILQKELATIQMLSYYIYLLGDDGEKLLSNLSNNIRNEVKTGLLEVRLNSTYRTAKEIALVINRNIISASRELELSLPGFESIEEIRQIFDFEMIESVLKKKSLDEWLILIKKSGGMRLFMNETPRKILTGGFSSKDTEASASADKGNSNKQKPDGRFVELQKNLGEKLSVPVLIKSGTKGGHIMIKFATLEQLNTIAKNIID